MNYQKLKESIQSNRIVSLEQRNGSTYLEIQDSEFNKTLIKISGNSVEVNLHLLYKSTLGGFTFELSDLQLSELIDIIDEWKRDFFDQM